jgi:serine/threonine-protein kinase
MPYQGNAAWIAIFGVVVLFSLIGGGLFFARRNLRLGRGDRRGAWRLVLYVLCLQTVMFILIEHHVASFWELQLVLMFFGFVLSFMGFTWALYIGLEPFVRRRWPHILVSWSRLLSGEWRDPLVGRDVLIGCATGVTLALLARISVLAPSWLGGPLGRPILAIGIPFLRTRTFIASVALSLFLMMVSTLAFLFIIVLLRTLLRSDWLAFAGWVLVASLGMQLDTTMSGDTWIGTLIVLVSGVLMIAVLTRVGLVALMITQFVSGTLIAYPITFDTSAWYSGFGFAALAIVAVVTLYGFRTSLGSRKLFEPSGVES